MNQTQADQFIDQLRKPWTSPLETAAWYVVLDDWDQAEAGAHAVQVLASKPAKDVGPSDFNRRLIGGDRAVRLILSEVGGQDPQFLYTDLAQHPERFPPRVAAILTRVGFPTWRDNHRDTWKISKILTEAWEATTGYWVPDGGGMTLPASDDTPELEESGTL